MVEKVQPHHMKQFDKDIEREKKNIFYIMHPALNLEEQEALDRKIAETQPDPDKTWFKLRKITIESTKMAPVPLSEHYNKIKNISNQF